MRYLSKRNARPVTLAKILDSIPVVYHTTHRTLGAPLNKYSKDNTYWHLWYIKDIYQELEGHEVHAD